MTNDCAADSEHSATTVARLKKIPVQRRIFHSTEKFLVQGRIFSFQYQTTLRLFLVGVFFVPNAQKHIGNQENNLRKHTLEI